MILYSIRGRIGGFAPDAIAWAHEIAALVKKKTGVNVEVATRLGGAQDIIWLSRYDSLAAMEAAQAKLPGDADYLASLKKATEKGFLIAGATESAIWRTQ